MLLLGTPIIAQETDTDTEVENDFEYRTSFKFSYKPIKNLKLTSLRKLDLRMIFQSTDTCWKQS